MNLRVKQEESDKIIEFEQVRELRAGTFLGDGMSHHADCYWSWTRVRVVANDQEARVIVVRFPSGEYSVHEYVEVPVLYCLWRDVEDNEAVEMTGPVWAANSPV